MRSILFMIDDANYNGGAHVALYNQIAFLKNTGKYKLAIVSLSAPTLSIQEKLEGIEFIRINKVSEKTVAKIVSSFSCVCVPFENSVFRETVSNVKSAYKIQWVHIDYFNWRRINATTVQISQNDRSIYANFDQIVFVSYAAYKGFISLFPELSCKCSVCYNLMNVDKIFQNARIQEDYKCPYKIANALRLVTIARIDETQKAIWRYVEVAARLKRSGCRFEWIFLGSGPLFEEVKTECVMRGLSEEMHFLGQVENPHIYVKYADVFALFSYYEGIPNTIFESLIIGTPVIATSITGVQEQISEETGWLVSNDENSIFEGIKYLSNNKQDIESVRQKLLHYIYDNVGIQQKVEKLFDAELVVDTTLPERTPLISVIVPVYNVEKYLPQCLESLVNQTLDSMEIIVVNDGSPDNCKDIIQEYSSKYPDKIIALTKENGGLGSARNHGIKHARGYYLAFVDGDDWVDIDCYKTLLNKALSGNYDIILHDLYGYDNNTGELILDKTPFACEGKLDKKESVLFSTRPVVVSACTKLFKKEVFDMFSFPTGWYEDLSVMTTIFSYVGDIYYLPQPLYYYRWNRAGSIQSQKKSEKTLDIYRAQQHILDTCNPKFYFEGSYAIYDHLCRFQNSFPFLKQENLEFINKNKNKFENNEHIRWAIQNGTLPKLFSQNEIPRIIHYCWFGGGKKSELIDDCIKSWKKHLPNYEIIEWNESNCNVNENEYVRQAYGMKKWAFVSDYFRFKALYEFGGIYLDTDIKVFQTFDSMRFHRSFFAFETYLYVHGGIIGSLPKQNIIKNILVSYHESIFDVNKVYTVCHRITEQLLKKGLTTTGEFQILEDDIAVYTPNVLTVNFSDGKCIAEHLYDATWMEQGIQGKTHRYEVLKHYFEYPLLQRIPSSSSSESNCYPQYTSEHPYVYIDYMINSFGLKKVARQWLKAVLNRIIPNFFMMKLKKWMKR